jgi:sigma-B regulation protein RsbU (phosphoserine phosphatase)
MTSPQRSGFRAAAWVAISGVAVAAAFVGDWLTGSEASFSFIYLIAIALGTWFIGRGWGLLLSLLSAAGWTGAYFLGELRYSRPHILLWNIAVELAIFAGVTVTLARIRTGRARERALRLELEGAYRRLDREMRSVGELQRSLLPAGAPSLPGWGIAVHYSPSTSAGGDHYDFLTLSEGHAGVWVADASGHGAPAAVVMAMTRVLLRNVPASGADGRVPAAPALLLTTLNRQLCRTLPDSRFVTACYTVLDPAGGLAWALAGHPPPLLLRAAGGAAKPLGTDVGPPLGLFDDARFECRSARLAPGDTLVLYTDGITEAVDADGEQFGEERLRCSLEESRCEAPWVMLDRVLEALARHVNGIAAADDVTLLVLRAGDSRFAGRPARE